MCTFLDELDVAVPPVIILISTSGGLGRLSSFHAGCPWGPFLPNEPLQLSLPNKSFYLLLQVITFGHIVVVIAVEMAVLVSRSFAGVTFQLAKECQGSFVLDLP